MRKVVSVVLTCNEHLMQHVLAIIHKKGQTAAFANGTSWEHNVAIVRNDRVLLLLFVLTFVLLRRDNDLAAGLCLGVGLFKFQFTLPFFIIFALRKRWRFVTGFALTASALAILSFVAVGSTGVLSYFRLLIAIMTHPANVSLGSAADMATVHGFVHALLKGSANATMVLFIVVLTSIALLLFLAWRWGTPCRGTTHLDLMFAASIVGSLLVGSHMFTHDLSPLLLAMLLVASHQPEKTERALRATLWTTLTLFWAPPVYFLLIAWHRMYLLFPALLLFAGGTILLAEKHADTLYARRLGARAVS